MAKIMYTHFHECFHAYLRLGLVKFKKSATQGIEIKKKHVEVRKGQV